MRFSSILNQLCFLSEVRQKHINNDQIALPFQFAEKFGEVLAFIELIEPTQKFNGVHRAISGQNLQIVSDQGGQCLHQGTLTTTR